MTIAQLSDRATIEAITYNDYGCAIGMLEDAISASDFYLDRDYESREYARMIENEHIVYFDEGF